MGLQRYSITVQGQLGDAGRSAFSDLDIDHDAEPDCTVLRGTLDQAGLFGVLHRIQSLAITLLEVRRID